MSVSPSAPVSPAAPAQAPTQADLLDFVRRTAADAELIASLPSTPKAAPGYGSKAPRRQ